MLDQEFINEEHPEKETHECECGRYKSKRVSFCYHCFINLPNEMSSKLHLQYGRGYEEAYQECLEYLKIEYYPLLKLKDETIDSE